MRRLVVFLSLAGSLAAGCSLLGPPTPIAVPEPANQAVLSVENRGGPTLSIRVNGAEVLELPCNDGRTIAPNVDGVPRLPWIVTIARKRDDVILVTQPVADLPQWFVQIGDTPLGFSKSPVSGPAGPSCPPGG